MYKTYFKTKHQIKKTKQNKNIILSFFSPRFKIQFFNKKEYLKFKNETSKINKTILEMGKLSLLAIWL